MSKRDYEKAAKIAQSWGRENELPARLALVESFIEFFHDDNPRFDAARFRRACVPGANVKARKK